MILSVQIISIFCITLNNNADGIFLSWIYFVRYYFAEHSHTHTHKQTNTAPVLYSHSEERNRHSFIIFNHSAVEDGHFFDKSH